MFCSSILLLHIKIQKIFNFLKSQRHVTETENLECMKYEIKLLNSSMSLWAWEAKFTGRGQCGNRQFTHSSHLQLNAAKEGLSKGADASILIFIRGYIKASPQWHWCFILALTWKGQSFLESYVDLAAGIVGGQEVFHCPDTTWNDLKLWLATGV